MRPKIVPDVVSPGEVLSLSPQSSVREAARLMASANVAALLVADDGHMLGIVTERDVSARVVAAGLDPDATPLSRVMTPEPRSLAPDDSISEALELMRRHSFRHLPVVDDGGHAIAMVSVRDLNREFDWRLPDEQAATIAGLLLHESRQIPAVGQVFRFFGFRFEVLRRHRNQITSIRITPPASGPVVEED